jgi:hypothetical protein
VQANALHLAITIQKQLKRGNDGTTNGVGTHGQVSTWTNQIADHLREAVAISRDASDGSTAVSTLPGKCCASSFDTAPTNFHPVGIFTNVKPVGWSTNTSKVFAWS